MTTLDINAILASGETDLTDRATRNAISDMLRDAGRDAEADLLTYDNPVCFAKGAVRHLLTALDFWLDTDYAVMVFTTDASPAGTVIALFDGPPRDLEGVEGYVNDDGEFEPCGIDAMIGGTHRVRRMWICQDRGEWMRQCDEADTDEIDGEYP